MEKEYRFKGYPNVKLWIIILLFMMVIVVLGWSLLDYITSNPFAINHYLKGKWLAAFVTLPLLLLWSYLIYFLYCKNLKLIIKDENVITIKNSKYDRLIYTCHIDEKNTIKIIKNGNFVRIIFISKQLKFVLAYLPNNGMINNEFRMFVNDLTILLEKKYKLISSTEDLKENSSKKEFSNFK